MSGTVRVRISVAVNADGEWRALGSGSQSEADIADFLRDVMEMGPAESIHVIEADVPAPPPGGAR